MVKRGTLWALVLLGLFPSVTGAAAGLKHAGDERHGMDQDHQTGERDHQQDAQELIVDDDLIECPSAAFRTIQGAVDAARPGARIRVCSGTYDEQVTITKPLRIKGDNGAVVMPSPMTADTTSLASGAAIAAVILVTDTDEVAIAGLTIDGAGSGIAACTPTIVGIFYRNASGTVRGVTVRNTTLPPAMASCQTGLGIFVQSGGRGTSRVSVEESSVHDYQKNGITGNEVGTEIAVRGNVVTGAGQATAAGQNGIQVGFGAGGDIDGNSVTNHISSSCVSVSSCAAVAAGVLVFDADDVRITFNSIGKSQTGILVQGNHNRAEDNNVFGTLVFDGISLSGNHNAAETNRVTQSDEAGVSVQGDDNRVIGNVINEASIGVLNFGGVGNIIEANRISNTTTPVVDPPPHRGGLSPFR